MALTSVAVVASADETAAAVNNVKTKADLEEYVKSFDSFRTNELYDYGSTSNENFNKALDFAQNVLDDPEATVDDYTVAYMTLKAVYDHLAIYTADQLKTLIDSCTKIYETNNIYNEELSDEIYKNSKGDNDTWATYDEFVDAYEDALSVLNSSDSRIITDAYETLNWAKTTMKAYDTVTKAQFRTALKTYETALQKEYNYETWATGKIVDPTWAVSWAFDDLTYTWGVIYNACAANKDSIKAKYDELDKIKNATKTSNPDIVTAYQQCNNYGVVLNSFVADSTVRGSASSVKNLIKKYQGLLVHDYATTAAEKLFAAVEKAVEKTDTGKTDKKTGAKIYGSLKVEQYNGATFTFEDDYTTPWAVQSGWAQIVNAASGLHPDYMGTNKDIYAGITVQPTVAVYIKKNEAGYADIYDANGKFDPDMVAAAVTTTKPASTTDYFIINKGSKKDITPLLKVTAADITTGYDNHELNYIFDGDTYAAVNDHWAGQAVAGSWVLEYFYTSWNGKDGVHTSSEGQTTYAYTELNKAMALAEFYLGAKKEDFAGQDSVLTDSIYDISTTGKIAKGTAKGSSEEWSVVYNYLARALSDKYDASTGSHTKQDVIDLIDKSYELAEKTGDSAMFKYSHTALVEARQDALDWVKAANKDKKYTENVTAYNYRGKNCIADSVWNSLNSYYTTLNNDFNAFAYSYGDIYNKVAEIADLIDSEEIVATDAITSGMSDVLYRLFILRSLDDDVDEELDNDVFSVDVLFQPNNRVFTNTDQYKNFRIDENTVVTFSRPDKDTQNITWEHNELAKAYEALVAAVKAQTDPAVVLGDVDGDGKVTAADASEILKAVVGMRDPIANEVGDFNGDGAVTAADASAILRSVIGL